MKGIGQTLRETRLIAYFSKGRRWLILLFCVLLAMIIWLLRVLDDRYTKTIRVELDEIELPSRFSISNRTALPTSIDLEVTAKGNRLLLYTLRSELFQKPPRLQLEVDTLRLQREGGYWSFDESELRRQVLRAFPQLGEYFDLNVDRLSLRPDMITFDYAPMVSRSYPIILSSQFDFAEGSNLFLKSWQMAKEEVVAYGVKSQLDSLSRASQVINTDTMTIMLSDTGTTTVRVPLLKPVGIELSEDSVDVEVEVQALKYNSYTTSELLVRNLPEGLRIRLFPTKVKVTLLTPMGIDLESVQGQLSIFVDLSDLESNMQKRTLKVHTGKLPSAVHMIQVEPDEVEFIIEEQSEE